MSLNKDEMAHAYRLTTGLESISIASGETLSEIGMCVDNILNTYKFSMSDDLAEKLRDVTREE
jgi:hypothetical protein